MTRLVLLAAVGLVGCGSTKIECPDGRKFTTENSYSELAMSNMVRDFCGGAK